MARKPYLKNEKFLLELDNARLRQQYAKIILLDFVTEKQIQEITGLITGGTISVNGESSVRRTANLTFIVKEDSFNLFEVNNLISLNKKVILEVGLKNTTEYYPEEEIIWFPQGYYVITQPSISYSTSGISVSLQLKDKMCLLNGDCGGLFPAQTTLHEFTTIDSDGREVVKNPTIYQIIQELVNHFGGEQLGKIIINDIDERTFQTMRSTSTSPIYAVLTDNEKMAYELTAEQPESGDYKTFYYGDDVCYAPMEFTYPGDLIAAAGSSITSVLDSIKNTLGNFEYFYDIEGNFVFQEIKNYLNISQSTLINADLNNNDASAYAISRSSGKSVYSFIESPLVISYSVTPNYLNIKNDFLVWGTRKTTAGLEIPIRYHLVIDERPELKTFEHVFVYVYTDSDSNTTSIRAQIPITVEYDAETMTSIEDYGVGTETVLYEFVKNNVSTFYNWDKNNAVYIDVTDKGELVEEYTPTDWRTVLYLQGSLSDPYGTDSNYYYVELINEWPKLYDLRPAGSYAETDGPWYTAGTGQSFWASVLENPTTMDYYLDFIDTTAPIAEFSVNSIGRRQKVVNEKTVNCIFEPIKKIDNVAIDNALYEGSTLQQAEAAALEDMCEESGRIWTKVSHDIFSTLALGGSYYSAYAEIRANLEAYTDYNESLSISCVPILHLEPNTRITVTNNALGINGDYMIKSFSIPLELGTMSIQANKVVERL